MKTPPFKKILILGSGGLTIGQAGEFDYSGSQAIKALKEEGVKTILINPNIATLQTSQNFADKVYFLPVTPEFVTGVIKKEKPDGILLGFGGQTALNCGIELSQKKILQKYGVAVAGTSVRSIVLTEDRGLFARELSRLNIGTPQSCAIRSMNEGIKAAHTIGFPVIVRAAYALGGLGSGFCKNEQELKNLLKQALTHSKQVLVEESLKGWKEIEYEVMRDQFDNCMTVCNMENFDPLGIHTGESIVVAPSQTLSDREYHILRRVAIKVIRHLKIVGECNIQFALNPHSEEFRVIEVNARLSRSSALASKATGYPLAFIAAKLALGKNLLEIPNPVTKVTKAFFEPALDYLVVKFPRWDNDKFKNVDRHIGSSMKSVGEVMAIGRKFEEALQKSIRMIYPKIAGITDHPFQFNDIDHELKHPTDKRIFAIAESLKRGYSIEKIHRLTRIDRWFLLKIKNIFDTQKELKKYTASKVPEASLKKAKQLGFSDRELARIFFHKTDETSEKKIRTLRKQKNILPVIKQIDTLAAEYPAQTNYLYLTYNGDKDDIEIQKKGIIVLGSGSYSIGSSVEFDWCSVQCTKTIRKLGTPAVVINYNPETVSTDYDECDRLYFEELTLERVLDIYEKEHAHGIIVSMGGQIPNTLAMPLQRNGVPILGTDPKTIDSVEDRHAFSNILKRLNINQPEWSELSSFEAVKKFCHEAGFPVLVRPSYVLSGSAMSVATNITDLKKFLQKAQKISPGHAVIVSKFYTDSKEIDVDVVADKGKIKLCVLSEHIEHAGVHSGDATLVTPSQRLYVETVRQINEIVAKMVRELKITGPLNFQFLAQNNNVKMIECNLRASRSFPFVSKVYNVNFIEYATKAILGKTVPKIRLPNSDLGYVGVKAPQFSFTRLRGADPQLGVEMASTGEVACLGENDREAFLKALLATGFTIPKKNILLSSGDVKNKMQLLKAVKKLKEKGYTLYATTGTADFYKKYHISMHILHWPLEKKSPNTLDFIKNGKIELVINIPKSNEKKELSNDYIIRRTAADFSIPLITNAQCVMLLADALSENMEKKLLVKSSNEYYKTSLQNPSMKG